MSKTSKTILQHQCLKNAAKQTCTSQQNNKHSVLIKKGHCKVLVQRPIKGQQKFCSNILSLKFCSLYLKSTHNPTLLPLYSPITSLLGFHIMILKSLYPLDSLRMGLINIQTKLAKYSVKHRSLKQRVTAKFCCLREIIFPGFQSLAY